MADMQEIYDAIRVADAAGDTDSVKRLASYIQETGTPAAAQVEPVAPEPTPQPDDTDPWLGKRISEDIGERAGKVKEFAAKTDILHAPEVVGVAAGQMAGAVGDVIGEIIKSTYKTTVPQEKQEEIKAGLKSIAETPIGKAGLYAMKEGGEFYKQFKEANPDSALALESGLNIAALGAGTGATKATAQKISAIRNTPIKLTKQFNEVVTHGINKGIRPSVAGKKTFSQAKKFDDQAAQAVETIIDNKQNLTLPDKLGFEVKGKLPENLRDFSQSIEQTKRQIFKEYDDMAKKSLEVIDENTTAALHKGKRVNPQTLKGELDRIGEHIAGEQAKAGKGALLKEAEKHVKEQGQPIGRAMGETVKSYENRMLDIYKRDFPKASAAAGTSEEVVKLQARQAQVQEILGNLKPEKAIVDFSPVVTELDKIAATKALKLADPASATYAKEWANRIKKGGDFTTEEAQDLIKILNSNLESFYKNPSYDSASRAYIDALVANNIRNKLDDVITKATGPGYSELKKQYGALKSLEKDLTQRMVVDARKNQKGLIDFSDILTGDRAIQGIMTMDPATAASAGFMKAIASHIKRLNDPNVVIKNMFKKADKIKSLPNYVQKTR